MNVEQIVGRATPEETKELLMECIRQLPETDAIEAIDQVTADNDNLREELANRFEGPSRYLPVTGVTG
jgi:hypothetical protein